mmetsp:Transcript_22773/g.59439  ORF Transcript_22773/g.59439 Transcript_22773/m.59439 type:complete len:230 (-) Transcript_22773:632-1321(-)
MSSFCLGRSSSGASGSRAPSSSLAASLKTYSKYPPDPALPRTLHNNGCARSADPRPPNNRSVSTSSSRSQGRAADSARAASLASPSRTSAPPLAEPAVGLLLANSSNNSVVARTVSTSRTSGWPSSSKPGRAASSFRSKHGCTQTWYTSRGSSGAGPALGVAPPGRGRPRSHQAPSRAKRGLLHRHQRCNRLRLWASSRQVLTSRPCTSCGGLSGAMCFSTAGSTTFSA